MAGTTRRRGIVAEINVTPLVDIMLVLLIIFMLTAHLISKQAIEVELPRAAESTSAKPTTLAVTLTADGGLFLGAAPITPDGLRAAIRAAVAKDPKTQAIIAADKVVAHGRVVWVLDAIRTAGVSSFAIQIDPRSPSPEGVTRIDQRLLHGARVDRGSLAPRASARVAPAASGAAEAGARRGPCRRGAAATPRAATAARADTTAASSGTATRQAQAHADTTRDDADADAAGRVTGDPPRRHVDDGRSEREAEVRHLDVVDVDRRQDGGPGRQHGEADAGDEYVG
jgi:biopolymer transport protein ExbD